jgi:hypothetical protein
MVERTCADEHTGGPNTSMTDMNTARTKRLILENRSNTWEIASTTKTRKQKWLFATDFKRKSPKSIAAEFIDLCKIRRKKNLSKGKGNPVTGPVVAQRGVEVQLYFSKTSALEGGE